MTKRLAQGFTALVVLTTGLIVLGALVRAHDAGLACPDWPQCFGVWIPRFDLQVAFEWTHRLVAGSVALLFAFLAAVTLRRLGAFGSPPSRRRVTALLAAAAGLLVVQILLGAFTVWLQLASWTVTAHLLTGNAFNAALFATALTLRATPEAPAPPVRAAFQWAVPALAGLLILQLLLGGLVSSRYAGLACPEWPTCNGGSFFPSTRGTVGLHLAHRMVGYAFAAASLAVAWWARTESGLRRTAGVLAGLAVFQVGVGVANVLWALPVEITGLHSGLAALLVLTVTALLLESRPRA